MGLTMTDKIKIVQGNLETRPDGDPGPHTWDVFYRAMQQREKVITPYAFRAFREWLIVAKPENSFPFDPNNKPLKMFKNSISGSFSWDGAPISIMIAHGKVIRWHSCHHWAGELPESVLCYYKDGS